MALTVGAYLWPEQDRVVAVVATVVITAVNIGGLSRTVAVTKVLLVVSVTALAVVVIGGWSSPDASLDRLTPFDTDVYGVLQSAGFLFFAFAGYARIATLGEEVKDPAITIPRAIPRTLAAVLVRSNAWRFSTIGLSIWSWLAAKFLSNSTTTWSHGSMSSQRSSERTGPSCSAEAPPQ